VYVHTKAIFDPSLFFSIPTTTNHPYQSTDYYKDLGIPKTASLPEIKKAYKKMSRTCHPDIVPDKLDEWHKVSRAYEVRDILSLSQSLTYPSFLFSLFFIQTYTLVLYTFSAFIVPFCLFL
jgi:preprotein translocase subunit Sec63